MKAITAEEAKEFDRKAREVFGISTLVLMENAGRAVAEEALKMKRQGRIVIFCGKGNNGGDGFVAARHLLLKGVRPLLYLAGRIKEVKSEAAENLNILLKLRFKVTEVNENNAEIAASAVKQSGLIIDALLGVGLKGEVRGVTSRIINAINLSRKPILSVDIPSGLDATTAEVLGSCIKAHSTVTFVALKKGMLKSSAKKYCGRVIIRDIGAPYA